MKIDLGHGAYMEADEGGPRLTPYHRQMIIIAPIPGTTTGYNVTLECGHRVQVFGDPKRANGVVLCLRCRDSNG